MNTHPGTLGIKLGMTQLFRDDGTVERVTVIEAKTFVVGKRTIEKDGYSALIVGLGERKQKHTNKPMLGFYKTAGVAPKHHVKEFRLSPEIVAEYEIGQKLELDKIFEPGQIIDVQSKSRGRGFSGVMRRHNFKGSAAITHGTHEYKRHGGSIGTNMTPGRTLPGVKMPGQHGNKTCSVLNQRIVKVLPEQDLLLIRGGVPGSKSTVVIVRGAIKKLGGKKKS
ncbi:MAG: 50S ribosomal protein L3 [Polyangiaceae bacterium]|jgi:large subunit ribosomal protein L3|nr:50S ribosomal protein L3 [Polyangiaceae bacterium]